MDIRVNSEVTVCFDLDDTLYNEIEFLKSGYRHIAKMIDDDWLAVYERMYALYEEDKDVFMYLDRSYGFDKHELLQSYRYHIPNIKPFPGVQGLFDRIKQKKGYLAVITDGRSETQRNKLRQLGLLDNLDALVISEEVGVEKPDGRGFEKIQKHFNCSEYYYIGDNYHKDFLSPNKLGWHTIALKDNGLNIHKTNENELDDPDYYPKHVINSLSDLRVP